MQYSREQILAAARARGMSIAQIEVLERQIAALKQHGLVSTAGGGVGLTAAGRRKVAELKAAGKIPTR